MTLTETRPPDAAAPAPAAAPGRDTWITTTDHKRIGRLWLGASFVFLLIGVVLAILLAGERAEPGDDLLGDQYGRVFALHAVSGMVLFLAPAWQALGTFLVPLQIGARRLAFPRLQAMALWAYVFGGAAVVTSAFGDEAVTGGIALPTPMVAPQGGADWPVELWILGLALVTVASIAAAVNLLVTVLRLRAPGLTLARVPGFTWATAVTAGATLLAAPAFLGGLLLLLVDQRSGGSLFSADTTGADTVWQHGLWLFGRPEAYLLALPALGVVTDVVSTHAGRPLFGRLGALGAIGAFGVLAFGIWTVEDPAAQALLPTPTVVTGLLVLPVLACLALWLNTARLGRPRGHVSLLFAGGFVGLVGLGALNAAVSAVVEVKGSAWATGQIHAVLVGAPVLALAGALHHWAPKLWGRHLGNGLGAVSFLLLFAGFAIAAAGSWLLGYDGAPWHAADLSTDAAWTNLSRMSAAGGVLVTLGVLTLLANIAGSALLGRGGAAEADPYGGLTLEWATSSPPPPDNFTTVPEIRSDAPLLDARAREGASA